MHWLDPHEKSPLSLDGGLFVGRTERSASDAEHAVGEHPRSREAADDDAENLGDPTIAAPGAAPVFRSDQVDGDGGFAYVGRLFHGRNIAQPNSHLASPRMVLSPAIAARPGCGRAKNNPPKRVQRAFCFEVDVPEILIVVVRDSRYKMPCHVLNFVDSRGRRAEPIALNVK